MKHSFYKKFGKRTTALILSALLTASLLTGCGGNGGSSASAGETGTNPGGEDGVVLVWRRRDCCSMSAKWNG